MEQTKIRQAKLKRQILQEIHNGLAETTLSDALSWALKWRVMSGSFPGPYTTKYHPWVSEPSVSKAPFNYVMKAAQLGLTEVAINRALFTLDKKKKDVLYVLPTRLVASDFSKSRFADALTLSPYIKSIFTETNSVNLKKAGASNLYIRGSRSDAELVSIPVATLFLDEVDRMSQKQVWLVLERLSGQLEKEVWGISTPTIPNFGIHKLYKNSTQEHFMFKCPRCSRYTELIFPECLEVVGETVEDPRCKESFLKCKECQGRLEHADKPNFLADAKWVAAEDTNPDVRGFHINQLYSYTITPGELAVSWIRGHGDQEALEEFHNSKLGLPFVGDGAKVDDAMLDRAVHAHSNYDARPIDSSRLITAGVDQGKFNHVVVCEWFNVNWLDPSSSAHCKILFEGKFLGDDWNKLDELLREWQVHACVVDADPQINEARRFAKRNRGHVWLARYRRGQSEKEVKESEDRDAPLLTVDRTNWLSASLGRFKVNPTRIHIPRDVSLEFRDHIKALVGHHEKDSKGVSTYRYTETGPDHFAHALTYAEIALTQTKSRARTQKTTGV